MFDLMSPAKPEFGKPMEKYHQWLTGITLFHIMKFQALPTQPDIFVVAPSFIVQYSRRKFSFSHKKLSIFVKWVFKNDPQKLFN